MTTDTTVSAPFDDEDHDDEHDASEHRGHEGQHDHADDAHDVDDDAFRLRLADDAGDHSVEELALPLVMVSEVRARIADALDHVAVTRKGALVMGPKSIGKSVALTQAVTEFHRAEAMKEAKNAGYARRSVLMLPALTDRSYRDALLLLCSKVIGPTFRQRMHGAPKKDDALLEELLLACLNQRIVAFAFGEAERLKKESMRLLRDIIADGNYYDQSGLTAEQTVRAGGVGVLLVGTSAVRPLVETSGEAGHRWTLLVKLPLLPHGRAAEVYRTWFPMWAAYIERVGDADWQRFIGEHVTHGRPISLGMLQDHARLYFRRASRMERDQGRTALTRETTPFSRKLFVLTIKELNAFRRGGDA